MRTFLIILMGLSSILISCDNQNSIDTSNQYNEGYKLVGVVKGVEDSTKIKLVSAELDKILDSTVIINEQFEFIGSLEEPIFSSLKIQEKEFRLWIENSLISFQSNIDSFSNAIVEGSKTQYESEEYFIMGEPIRDEYFKAWEESQNWSEQEIEDFEKKMDSLSISIHTKFIEKYPNSFISPWLLKDYCTLIGKEGTNNLYNLMPEDIQKSTYGKIVFEFIELNQDLNVGDLYYNFTQNNIKGIPISLKNYDGKYLLLEFWASWCEPCREENPELLKVYNEFNTKGFEILGVSIDRNKERWINAVQKDGLAWENVSDLKGDRNEAALIYGVYGVPRNFLINPDGVILARDLTLKKLKIMLEELLN